MLSLNYPTDVSSGQYMCGGEYLVVIIVIINSVLVIIKFNERRSLFTSKSMTQKLCKLIFLDVKSIANSIAAVNIYIVQFQPKKEEINLLCH